MVNKFTFCSSPWLHIRLHYTGTFLPCRWGDHYDILDENSEYNIRNMGMLEYFNSKPMTDLRQELLQGGSPQFCHICRFEDANGKISGRRKQLFRSRLDDMETFDEKFPSNRHIKLFQYSEANAGRSDYLPIDLQINLGNACNSSCIMCNPASSSRLHTEYKKMSFVAPHLFKMPTPLDSWSDDPVLVQRFVDDLKQLPNLEYIHLTGGETFYSKGFYTICEALVETGLSKNIILGTTTNGTIYSERFVEMIPKFRDVHLGVSIETVNRVNDYIRFPGNVSEIIGNIKKFAALRSSMPNLTLTLGIVPSVFSVFYFDEMIQFMLDNDIIGEVNAMIEPRVMRIELLPRDMAVRAADRLQRVAEKNGLERMGQTMNTRDPNSKRQVISNLLYEHMDLLMNMVPLNDDAQQRKDLADFLNAFESQHKNRILDYAPEFSDFLRECGYDK